ncbi:MAG: hypothetical protein AAFU78_14910 [Cyanobacteria bacterium J06633_2]
MADTPKTRISIDVWEQAGQVAERMGLNGERAAIEAVFRCFHDAYVLGDVPVSAEEGRANPDVIRIASTPSPEPEKEPNCAADLNNLLNA